VADQDRSGSRPAPARDPVRQVGTRRLLRIPVRTRIVTDRDDILNLADEYTAAVRRPGDIFTISEKVVAISQGRAHHIREIRVGFWAGLLWRFVRKVPYGIGLRSPYSMQCAVDEVGAPRILIAALVGGLTRLFGRRGDFYRIAGKQAAMIDAAHTAGVKQYYEHVIKGPKDPELVAQRLSVRLGLPAAIVDVNDIGGSWVVGGSPGLDVRLVEEALRDNPAGQGDACTPIILLRDAPGSPATAPAA
jgi:hypothetical protein